MKTKIQKVYDELVEAIRTGVYRPHSKLPSEHELMDTYQVARGTIRAALDLLYQNGYIQKVQGKGSVVLDVQKFDFPVSGLVSFKQLSKTMNGTAVTNVQELTLLQPNTEVQEYLKVNKHSEVWKLVRVREINGEKIILDIDYFNRKYVPFLTKEICEGSVYEYLETELKLPISFAKKEIVVEEPTPKDRELLDLQGSPYVVVVKSHVYLDDTSLFQYTESRHRPDKFRFVDFARRVRP
jgi:GntR family transcriptional regulator, trehalose operon transcriptional repressor